MQPSFEIRVAARSSKLSQAQVWEVWEELKTFHPSVRFLPQFIQTAGDCDLRTSLKDLERTNFFTRELDELLLSGGCDVAIHSAKDLPDPLPKGLSIIALTQGVDPSDVLVLRDSNLPMGGRIGTSSKRREEAVQRYRADLICVDIRRTVDQRLEQLYQGLLDGLVVAEAALIRLNMTHLKRMRLDISPAAYQGRLAILARSDDQKMRDLFAPIDAG